MIGIIYEFINSYMIGRIKVLIRPYIARFVPILSGRHRQMPEIHDTDTVTYQSTSTLL